VERLIGRAFSGNPQVDIVKSPVERSLFENDAAIRGIVTGSMR
jgi:hypothetical protein